MALGDASTILERSGSRSSDGRPLRRVQEAVHQDLRLPDERLRLRPHGGCPGAARLCRDDRPDDADLVILNTCHIREKAAEKVYSELGRLRQLRERRRARGADMTDRRGRLRGPGRRPGDARAGAVRRHRGRPAGLPSAAGAPAPPGARPGQRAGHRFPAGEQVRSPAGGAGRAAGRLGVPHGPGRLRQVLHLLRRPLHPRRRGLAPGGGDPRRGAPPGRGRRARDHAARPERQRLSGRGARRPRPGAWRG